MRYEQHFLEGLKSIFTISDLDGLEATVNALREVQSATGDELDTFLPSVLDRAFKGEL